MEGKEPVTKKEEERFQTGPGRRKERGGLKGKKKKVRMEKTTNPVTGEPVEKGKGNQTKPLLVGTETGGHKKMLLSRMLIVKGQDLTKVI